MQNSIKKYFKVGILSFMVFPDMGSGESPKSLDHLMRLATDDYFDAIEICRLNNSDIRRDAARILDIAHMDVCYGAHPIIFGAGLNPNAIDETERQTTEHILINCIDEAQEVGSNSMAFLAGKYNAESQSEAYQQLLKTTIRLCKYAEPRGIQIELEVFDFDVDKCSFMGPASYVAQFAADVRKVCHNFGLIVDLSHIPLCHESTDFVIQTLRPYITHFHIGNAVCDNPASEGYGDYHQRFGFPNSRNDVAEVLHFLQVLKREGFFYTERPYVLSFEIKPWKDENPELVIANAKRTLNRAWALLED